MGENGLFKELERALNNYLEARAEYGRAANSKHEIDKMAHDVPDVITCDEDFRTYQKAVNEWAAMVMEAENYTRERYTIYGKAEFDLLRTIPIEHVWFKVNDWAVGKYRQKNVIGGQIKISVLEWNESLPRLKSE